MTLLNPHCHASRKTMNTLTANPSNPTATLWRRLAAPLSSVRKQGADMRVWAFSAAVRLSDQDKPIALKLVVELALVVRTLAVLASRARRQASAAAPARRAPQPAIRTSSRRPAPSRKPRQGAQRPSKHFSCHQAPQLVGSTINYMQYSRNDNRRE
jgi:hypothetical protein